MSDGLYVIVPPVNVIVVGRVIPGGKVAMPADPEMTV